MGGSPGSPGCCQLDSCRGEVMVPGGACTEGHASCFLFFIFFRETSGILAQRVLSAVGRTWLLAARWHRTWWGCCGDGLPVHPVLAAFGNPHAWGTGGRAGATPAQPPRCGQRGFGLFGAPAVLAGWPQCCLPV